MTGDARGEAEAIVNGYLRALDYYERAPNSDEREDALRGTEERLVAALAAAIEVTDEVHSDWALDAALDDLRDALSALRARAGEETE